MRNVFLDLGTHHGQGLSEFVQRFNMGPEWIIHTFEANPVTYEIYMKNFYQKIPWVIPHNVAVSDHYGMLTLNQELAGDNIDHGMASSVIEIEKWNPFNMRDDGFFRRKKTVPSIDLSNFISENFDRDDNIVVKMDVEGSEFAILQKMIQDDTISYVKLLSVEWHSKFFTNLEEMQKLEVELIEKLKKYPLILESWK